MYTALYDLQDRVLETVFSIDSGFYLTGGTCLHRFYYNKRYSDDLDFFSNDNNLFREEYRATLEKLKNLSFKVVADTRDFVRLQVNELLQVDFVNDRVKYCGNINRTENGLRIDNSRNILANKISAVIGRDEPKDIFDIYTIAQNEHVEWKLAIDDARQKCVFEDDELEFRLKNFPVLLLENLNVIDLAFRDELLRNYNSFVNSIASSI